MTLVEVCEPIFQYVCRLNRMGRKGGRVDPAVMRSEVIAILGEMRVKAAPSPDLSVLYEGIEEVLTSFVDSMIVGSRVGAGWKPLSVERGREDYEQRFWTLLEEALSDSGEAATQRLSVFYECIGLGFTGGHAAEPEFLRRKMLEISARLKGFIDADAAARVCPEAYEGVDTRNLTLPPHRSVGGLVIALVALTVVLLAAYVQMFRHAGQELTGSLSAIQERHARDVQPGAKAR